MVGDLGCEVVKFGICRAPTPESTIFTERKPIKDIEGQDCQVDDEKNGGY